MISNVDSPFELKNNNNDNWFVCLDTASYLCTSTIDLSSYKPDFLVASFYKIFGFPTGNFKKM